VSALSLPRPREIFLLCLQLNLYLFQELSMGFVFDCLFQLLTEIPVLILGKGEPGATLQGWADVDAAQARQHYTSLKGHIAHIGQLGDQPA